MDAKEFLQQYYYAKIKLDSLQTELAYLEELANGTQGCSFDTPRVDKTPTLQAPFIKYIDRIDKKKKQIDEQISKLLDIEEQISKVIEAINDPIAEVVLRERYINCLSWSAIAKKLNYVESYVYKLHRQGLAKIKLDNETR